MMRKHRMKKAKEMRRYLHERGVDFVGKRDLMHKITGEHAIGIEARVGTSRHIAIGHDEVDALRNLKKTLDTYFA